VYLMDGRGDMDGVGPPSGDGSDDTDGNGVRVGAGDGSISSAFISNLILQGFVVVCPVPSILSQATTSQTLLSVYVSGRYAPYGSAVQSPYPPPSVSPS